MSDFLTALAHDVAGEYEQAATVYERVIMHPQAPVEAFANLSFIYWEAVWQLSFTNGSTTPLALQQLPVDSCSRVLTAGLQRYPHDLELSFWARYYPYRGIYDKFSEADCRQLLADCVDHNQTLMPHFFLSLFDKASYRAEVTQILITSQQFPTAKNRYVASIIEPRPYERD
jgi:hypothetical protein